MLVAGLTALLVALAPGFARAELPHTELAEASALRGEGDLSGAAARFERLVAAHPEHPEPMLELAITRAFLGEHDAAIRLYDRVLTRWPDDVRAQVARARVLLWRGDHDEARRAYEAVLATDASNLDARRGLGAVLLARRDRDGARAAFETVLRSVPDDEEASRGLRTVAQQRDWVAEARGGLDYDLAEVVPRGSARLQYTASPEHTFAAGYRLSGARGIGDDGTPGDLALRHDIYAQAAQRWTPELSTSLQYTLSVGEEPVRHALGVRGSLRLAEPLTLLAGVRGGVRHDGRLEHLSDLGLQLALPSESFVMLRGFRYDDSFGAHSTSVSLSGRVGIESALWLDAAVGAAFGAQDDITWVASAGVTVALGEHTRLGAHYQLVHGVTTRHTAELSLRQEL